MSPPELILVVDDDISMQAALKDALEDEGFAVVVAGNGAEALRELRAGVKPYVILLDHMMPVMDGAQFVAEARKDPDIAAYPIILVTADAAAAEKSLAIGLSAYLRKPLKIDALLDEIARVTRNAASFAG